MSTAATSRMCIRLLSLLGLIVVTMPAAASPSHWSHGSHACRPGLNGSYGVKFDGHSKNLGRFASVSIWTFNSRGEIDASESFSSEVTGPQTRKVKGSYVLKADCSFKLLFPSELGHVHEAVGDCVLVDNGREFYCIDVEAGWVATAVGKKI